MAGTSLESQGFTQQVNPPYYSVKEAVFPFIKFPNCDPILGPEMKSTGEVMGVGRSFAEAFAKAQLAAGVNLPKTGNAFISVRDADKKASVDVARHLANLGFTLLATEGTAKVLMQAGIECSRVNKVNEGRPHIVDMIKNDEIQFIVNTTEGKQAIADSRMMRSNALQNKVTYTTTIAGAKATCMAMELGETTSISRLQDLHKELRT